MTGSPQAEGRLAEVRFLTVAEVATLMRVSKMTVYRLVHSGELTAVRVGRSFRVQLWPTLVFLRDGLVVKQVARPDLREVREGLEAIDGS